MEFNFRIKPYPGKVFHLMTVIKTWNFAKLAVRNPKIYRNHFPFSRRSLGLAEALPKPAFPFLSSFWSLSWRLSIPTCCTQFDWNPWPCTLFSWQWRSSLNRIPITWLLHTVLVVQIATRWQVLRIVSKAAEPVCLYWFFLRNRSDPIY